LALASEVFLSEDGKTYTFQLRDATWSDGVRVTSRDFAESWRTILRPEFPSDVAYQLFPIRNARAVKSGEKGLEELGIETFDSETLIVHLEQPIPYFLELCSQSSYLPIPSHIVASGEQWHITPDNFVGNGPFRLDSWIRNDQIQVVKNNLYWQADQVGPEAIQLVMVSNDTEIKMFEEGLLDWAGSPLSTIPADAVARLKSERKLKISPFSGTYFYRVNTDSAIGGMLNPLSSAAVRKALASALDRESVVSHLLQGGQTAAWSLVPSEMGLAMGSGLKESSPEEARAFLEKGLKELGLERKDFPPLRLSFAIAERNLVLAQAIQQQWEQELGIQVELEPLESKVFLQAVRERKFQLAAGSWIADFNDPVNFLEVFKYKSCSTNNTGWENSKYIDLLERSSLCRDQGERRLLLREAERLLMDEMPIIPLFHFAINYMEREGISQVALSPIGQVDFRWTQWEETSPSRR
jgi:oligopeptide transport system substrate-binding protein